MTETRPRNFNYVAGAGSIGHGFWGDSANAFPGLIDEVAVFNRALTAEEIAAIYNAGGSGKCDIEQYTLTVTKTGTGSGTLTSSDGGINCGSDCSESYSSGTSVTLTTTPSTGSTFASWGGDCSSCGTNTACGITMNADKTCTATFTAVQTNGPDLTGQWQSLTEQRFKGLRTRSGYLLRGALKISNIGNRDANGQFRVSYYLSNDGTTLGTPVGSTNVCVSLSRTSRTCQLKPATSVTLSFSYASTQSLKGNYVIAVIDEANNISETNENNNRASAQIQ